MPSSVAMAPERRAARLGHGDGWPDVTARRRKPLAYPSDSVTPAEAEVYGLSRVSGQRVMRSARLPAHSSDAQPRGRKAVDRQPRLVVRLPTLSVALRDASGDSLLLELEMVASHGGAEFFRVAGQPAAEGRPTHAGVEASMSAVCFGMTRIVCTDRMREMRPHRIPERTDRNHRADRLQPDHNRNPLERREPVSPYRQASQC